MFIYCLKPTRINANLIGKGIFYFPKTFICSMNILIQHSCKLNVKFNIICVDEIIALNKGIPFELTLIKVWPGKKLNCRLVTQILS